MDVSSSTDTVTSSANMNHNTSCYFKQNRADECSCVQTCRGLTSNMQPLQRQRSGSGFLASFSRSIGGLGFKVIEREPFREVCRDKGCTRECPMGLRRCTRFTARPAHSHCPVLSRCHGNQAEQAKAGAGLSETTCYVSCALCIWHRRADRDTAQLAIGGCDGWPEVSDIAQTVRDQGCKKCQPRGSEPRADACRRRTDAPQATV